jgi:hypothetical protein
VEFYISLLLPEAQAVLCHLRNLAERFWLGDCFGHLQLPVEAKSDGSFAAVTLEPESRFIEV